MFDHICSAAVFIAYHSLRGSACWKGFQFCYWRQDENEFDGWQRRDNLIWEIWTVVRRTTKLLRGWRWGKWKTCDNSGIVCTWYRIYTRMPELLDHQVPTADT